MTVWSWHKQLTVTTDRVTNQMEIDMTNISLADRYAAAKAAYDAADAALKAIKAEVNALGTDRVIGDEVDLLISLRASKVLSEALLLERHGVTKAQVEACKVEGNVSPVINIRAKKVDA